VHSGIIIQLGPFYAENVRTNADYPVIDGLTEPARQKEKWATRMY
jgi:hypothetical protein